MKIDFHVHTVYSRDSSIDCKKLLSYAKRKGLKGVAITDHGTCKGGIEVKKLNSDRDFWIIVGSEIRTEYGDIIGLFLREDIRSNKMQDVIAEIKDQNGLVVLPHPFRIGIWRNVRRRLGEVYDQYKDVIDLFEIFNGRSWAPQNNAAFRWVHERGVKYIVGSDAHLYNELGKIVVEMDDVKEEEDIKDKLLRGDFVCKVENNRLKLCNIIYSLLSGKLKHKAEMRKVMATHVRS